jgi:heterodisulfide reductase subunit A
VLVVGAGISGCTAAYNLACREVRVTLVEKAHEIGGRVRAYGCKAADKCQNCGVCLVGSLWDKVMAHQGIHLLTNATVVEVTGAPGNFTVTIDCAVCEASVSKCAVTDNTDKTNKKLCLDAIDKIVVSTGFDSQSSGVFSHLHIEETTKASGFSKASEATKPTRFNGIITGTELEKLLLRRTRAKLFETAPESVAFVQCLGSRDENESGLYCSRVCCAYSTRAAKLIRSYYPDCEIVFFYMELQNVEPGNFYEGLRELGAEFIKCRPLKIIEGNIAPDTPAINSAVTIEYDDPVMGIKSRNFDIAILSDGIRAAASNDKLAEIFMLGQDKEGFLNTIGTDCGIYVTGCAKAPMKIEEAYVDAIKTAGEVSYK